MGEDAMTFGELFAGVGGFSLGFEQAGWECRWQVEWDRHCQQVLARHWPEVARYDDVRNVAGGGVQLDQQRPQRVLGDDRLLTDHHNQQGSRHASSDDSKRVLLAQQRESGVLGDVGAESDDHGRIGVGDCVATRSVLAPVTCITFGSPCQDLSVAGKRAGLDGARSGLFFEAIRIIKEMRDATAGTLPRFAIWENVAGALSSNKGADFLAVLDAFAEIGAVDIAWRLVDAQHFGVPQRRRRVFVVADFGGECAGAIHVEPAGVRWHSSSSRAAGQEPAGSVRSGVATVVNALTQGLGSGGPDFAHADAGWLVPQIAPTLTAKMARGTGGPSGDECQNLVVQPFVKGKRASSPDDDESWRADQVSPTLNAFDNGSESRATVLAFAQNQRGEVVESECHHALTSGGGKPGEGYAAARIGSTVRRLTPLECERLNGFPDHHTRWRADGTEQSDSQRYRQMGNAVAVPCAAWLAWNLTIAFKAI